MGLPTDLLCDFCGKPEPDASGWLLCLEGIASQHVINGDEATWTMG